MSDKKVLMNCANGNITHIRYEYRPIAGNHSYHPQLAEALVREGLIPGWCINDQEWMEYIVPHGDRCNLSIQDAYALCEVAQNKLTSLLDEADRFQRFLDALRKAFPERSQGQ